MLTVAVAAHTFRNLHRMPPVERKLALEEVVAGVLRSVLLLEDHEPLSPHESLFSLGMSPADITEVQDRIARLLGMDLSGSILFNSCTVEQLIDYVVNDVLRSLPGGLECDGVAENLAVPYALWDSVLSNLLAESDGESRRDPRSGGTDVER